MLTRRFPGVPNLCDAKWHAALLQSFTLVLVVPLICGINSIMSSHLPFSRRQCAAPSINLSLNLPLCLSTSCETAALWLSHHTSISLSPPSPCPSPHNPSSHSALTQFFSCPPPSPPPSPPPLTQCYTSVSFFHFASIHLVVRHLSISHGLTYIFICVIVKTLLRCNHPDLQTSAWTAWQTFFIKKKRMNEWINNFI